MLIYACECVSLLKSEGDRLFNAWNTIYWKLFGVNDYDCIQDIVRYAGYLPISVDYDIRKYTLLYKLQYSNNQVLVKLHSMFAKQELLVLDLSYNVPVGSSYVKFKRLFKDILV